MRSNTSRGQKDPERPDASPVRDCATGRLFESYLALHRWRIRHGLPEASCYTVAASDVADERVHGPTAPEPEATIP